MTALIKHRDLLSAGLALGFVVFVLRKRGDQDFAPGRQCGQCRRIIRPLQARPRPAPRPRPSLARLDLEPRRLNRVRPQDDFPTSFLFVATPCPPFCGDAKVSHIRKR